MDNEINTILVSQPKPENNKSPFFALEAKHNIKVDFRSFIHIEGVDLKGFRDQRLNLPDFTAIILTSRKAVDNFFRICKESKYNVPDTLKYFCIQKQLLFIYKSMLFIVKERFFMDVKSS